MMSSRVVGLAPALRRSTLQRSFAVARNQAALRNVLIRRGIQTESQPAAKAMDLLNAQRLKRPSSPHFTIYQPQLTWIGSIANRATGVALGVLLYGFSIAYVVGPLAGLPFNSTEVVDLVHMLPESIKYAGKAILAAPFAYHTFNGLRHLAWDSGKFLTLKGAYSSGYAVLGATAITTIGLLFV